MTGTLPADAARPDAAPPRRSPWSLRRRLLAGFLALIVVLSATIGAVSTAVLRGTLVDRLDGQLLSSVERAATALRRLGAPTGGPDPDDPPPVGRFVLGEAAGAVGVLVVGGTVLTAGYLDATEQTRRLTAAQLDAIVALPADGAPHSVELGDLGSYRVVIEALSTDTAVIVGLPLDDVEATVGQLLAIIALVTALALAVAVVLGRTVVRIALRPLDRVVDTATHVAELRLEEGEVELVERVPEADTAPTTEAGRVGAALNRLLARVESALSARHASERKLRRFVADASHELRTPLASIRGYSEFVRMRAPDLDPDFARSLERIDSESQRMSVLVEELLLLARLDADPSLAREPVDLSRLLVDAVSDAHAAGPDHEWRVELPDEPVEVVGDAVRLQQVLANLLGNARVHTPAGTTVTAGVERVADAARITVLDDGPGVPVELRASLFERFVRGDDSRSRASGSTGLGLAIVRAIVEAHGGTVAVDSVPGRTRFALTLPA